MGDVDVEIEIEIEREGVKREGEGREGKGREEKMGGQGDGFYEVNESLALLLGFFSS